MSGRRVKTYRGSDEVGISFGIGGRGEARGC